MCATTYILRKSATTYKTELWYVVAMVLDTYIVATCLVHLYVYVRYLGARFTISQRYIGLRLKEKVAFPDDHWGVSVPS